VPTVVVLLPNPLAAIPRAVPPDTTPLLTPAAPLGTADPARKLELDVVLVRFNVPAVVELPVVDMVNGLLVPVVEVVVVPPNAEPGRPVPVLVDVEAESGRRVVVVVEDDPTLEVGTNPVDEPGLELDDRPGRVTGRLLLVVVVVEG
jgi:hypothetical protein